VGTCEHGNEHLASVRRGYLMKLLQLYGLYIVLNEMER